MIAILPLLAVLTMSAMAAPPTGPRASLRPREVPAVSVCYCNERTSRDYTIDIWIINKTTTEDGMLSQGLRDNFGVFCNGYFVLWSDVEPIVTRVATGESYPAGNAPQKLGAHVNTGFIDLQVTGYIVRIDLEGQAYDGCLSKVIARAENMNVTCPCPS